MATSWTTRPLGRATRDAYGDVLKKLGAERPDVVVLDADLASSTRSGKFAKEFPDRFVDMGISEANMVGVGAGLAASGKTVFISSFCSFLICKGFDQLRMAVAYPKENVKVIGTHGGITLGADGASQMSVEDLALALSLPEMTVIHPADDVSAQQLLWQLASETGPGYARLGREKAPIIYDAQDKLELGKAKVARPGGDVTIVACGMMVAVALDAADQLKAKGIDARVLDVHTLRPLDTATLTQSAQETGAFVVVEEHLKVGGLGALVAQATAETCPAPIRFVGLDGYAESGTAAELLAKYGLTTEKVASAALEVLTAKR